MSRIGKEPISMPAGVELKVSNGNLVTIKGPKGALTQQVDSDISVKIEDGAIVVARPTDQKRHRSLHGLYRSLIANMVTGVTDGYKKELELIGVGYRCANTGQLLELTLGYSHPVYFYIPDEVKLSTEMKKGSPPLITLEVPSVSRSLIKEKVSNLKVKFYAVKRVKQLPNSSVVMLTTDKVGNLLILKYNVVMLTTFP